MNCKRCLGRGFYLPSEGYTVADRRVCNRCGGSGERVEIKEEPPLVTYSNVCEVPPVKKKRTPQVSLYRKYGVEV